MLKLLVAFLLLVASTAIGGQITYSPTQDMQKFDIRVIIVHPDRINRFCQLLKYRDTPVKACVQWNLAEKTCTVIVPIPSMSKTECDTRDPETQICETYKLIPNAVVDGALLNSWGHELLHCVKGSYHD